MRLLIYGFGHIGQALARAASGFAITATSRSPAKRKAIAAMGFSALDPTDTKALISSAQQAHAILITAAPDADGCPAFTTLGKSLAQISQPKWLGYLSTTGVYGDRGGGWVFEDSPLAPLSPEAKRRVSAEALWQGLNAHYVSIFRLPGLYGPGRSVLDRLREGTARRIHKPGQVFSRLFEDDCATALLASIAAPKKGGVYNLCDDEPLAPDALIDYACATYGYALPPVLSFDDPNLSGMTRRFYNESKRVSNAQAKAQLGWRLLYPTYREGLAAINALMKDQAAMPRP
jgi:nucleoside-diphosphate-sugar epimerase